MNVPQYLKLEFSKAADYGRISALFDPAVKNNADPDNYIAKRLERVFRRTMETGSVAFLSDENNTPVVFTAAYHAHEDTKTDPSEQHDYTEFGSSLTLLPRGYASSLPVIAALAIREWLYNPPRKAIAADIKPQNIASVKVYQSSLGWALVEDEEKRKGLDVSCWRTVPDESDSSGEKGLEFVPDVGYSMDWFECDASTIALQARILLECMKQGGLSNKNGDFIPVDFSCLDQEHITKTRLESMAAGNTSREELSQITHNKHEPKL